MTKGEESELHEESAAGSSTDTTLNERSSAEPKVQNGNLEFTASSTAILEPSEDDPLFKREKIKRPFKTYKAIMKSYTSTEINLNSDEPSVDEEDLQQMGRNRSVCSNFLNRYRNFAIGFRNSRYIYIVQILMMVLPFTTICIGSKYPDVCPGSPNLTGLSQFTGFVAMALIGQWMAITCCGPADRPCEGQQKIYILLSFIFVTILLEFEIYYFIRMSPSFEPSTINYCNKMFYDYTYYKFIVAFASELLVTLLYFPDYNSFAAGIECSDPLVNSCYKGMLEEDD